MTDDPIKRARRHEQAGEIDQALAAYREVPLEAPAYAEARIRIVGIALLRGRLDEAEREARAFAAQRLASPEPHATLGQVLRLSFRHDDAIASFRAAADLAPSNAGYRMLLNDARRAKYWSPDADLYAALRVHATSGQAGASAQARLFHLEFVGLLNPEFQHWLTGSEADDALPRRLRESLDGRFDGRFSQMLAEVAAARERVRAPARARVVLRSGPPREALIEDADGTVGASLEAIDGDGYALLPFGELASVEFGDAAPYVRTRVVPRSGPARDVDVPALYFFTEGCRLADVREGRRTLWRALAPGLRVGVGLRCFAVDGGLVALSAVKRVEFV